MLKLIAHITLDVFAVVMLLSTPSFAQKTQAMGDARETYRKALSLYERKMYSLAQKEFDRTLEKGISKEGEQIVAQVEYYKLSCAYELWNSNVAMLVEKFVDRFPSSEKVNDAYLLLAKYYFKKGDYKNAVAAFDTFDSGSLSDDDFPEYAFKRGYSLFMQGSNESASSMLSLIKDGSSKYASTAMYYYSHIAYDQKYYAVALKGFENLRNDESFSRLVPYYILHIYHLQKNYDKVIAEGSQFVESVTGKRLPEIARIVAEAYYYKQQYDKALPFIEKFAATATNLTREDRYLIGYIYYQNRDYAKASKLFDQLVVGQDSLVQSAYYYLADSWLQMGDKRNAGRAFLQASKMDFFPDIKEDAMFNYAKLMFDLNSGPFNDAIEALHQYLETYPSSLRADEVNKYLMQSYVVSKNYQAALTSLSAIKKPDSDALAATQKVAYYRGVELFQNQDYKEAIRYFNLSLKHSSYNSSIAAMALYWKADAEYRLGNYPRAQQLLAELVLMPGTRDMVEYETAHYNLGYCYFKQKNYDQALLWFRKYVSFDMDVSPMLCDAYNRMGDCNFIKHSYTAAIEDYQQVIQMCTTDADYATYQSGLCFGLVRQMDKKIEYMNKVIAYKPASPYADNAIFEKGRTYVQMLNYAQAVNVFSQLLNGKDGAFYAKALVELGLICVNQGDTEKALEYYKRVVAEFPGTSESRNAMLGIKNIYMASGDVNAYFSYAGAIGNYANINISEKDSITFAAAEIAYNSDNMDRGMTALQKYLEDFPNGAFKLDASFYLAEIYYRQGKLKESLPHFKYVIDASKNDYTELALQGGYRASYELGEYAEALKYYE
ncbi:MAG: tetratricopeptide repeat protein, partial [Prevotellaceae bacterium]|nr:tetratricopeptide repeat protein [Prevotellaceae bacterium]